MSEETNDTKQETQEKIPYHERLKRIRKVVFSDWLLVAYPKTFDVNNPVPLQIGIAKILRTQRPENVSGVDLKNGLGWYCGRSTYLKMMINATDRFDLEGNAVAKLTDDERKAAQKQFDARMERKRLNAEKRAKIAHENQTKKENSVSSTVEEINNEVLPKTEETVTEITPVIEKSEPEATNIVEETPKKTLLSLKSKTKIVVNPPPAQQTTHVISEPAAPIKKTVTAPKSTADGFATSKSLKVTLVLDPASIPNVNTAGKKRMMLGVKILNSDMQVTADLNPKSYRKSLTTIQDLGVENCNAILQGSMSKFGLIENAGLAIQPKKSAVADVEN